MKLIFSFSAVLSLVCLFAATASLSAPVPAKHPATLGEISGDALLARDSSDPNGPHYSMDPTVGHNPVGIPGADSGDKDSGKSKSKSKPKPKSSSSTALKYASSQTAVSAEPSSSSTSSSASTATSTSAGTKGRKGKKSKKGKKGKGKGKTSKGAVRKEH